MDNIEGEEINDEINEKLYVAVSKELKACKSILLWALQNSRGKKVCLIHVHQPAQTLSVLGGRLPISSLSEQMVMAHWERDKNDMCKILNKYLAICAKAGVQAEKQYIEMDIVENGIVELISQLRIERLVMGAAADNKYSRKIMELKSKKANYVHQNARDFCHIWFICKGQLIYTREGTSQSCLQVENENQQANVKPRLTQSTSGWSTPISRAESFEDFDHSSFFSLSPLSGVLRSYERGSLSKSLTLPPRPDEKRYHSRPANDDSMNDMLYDKLDQAIAEAKVAKREAFQETMKCHRAEKEASEAIQRVRAKAIERLYFEELKKRKEIQDDLAKAQELLESITKQRDKALEEICLAMSQKEMLETQVQKSDVVGKELKDKISSALDLLQNYKEL